MKLVLMGSPEFAIPTFELVHQYYSDEIVGVITQPDRAKGRSNKVQPTAIGNWANAKQLPLFKPESKKGVTKTLIDLKPTVGIVVAYGMILPKILTDQFNLINVHASLLPRYRGPSPIHAALLNNDRETGISIIKLNEKMDEGPIILQKSCPILPQDNFQSLHDKLAHLGAGCCIKALSHYAQNHPIMAKAQPVDGISYCSKLKASDAELLPTDTLTQKWAKIRAFSPYPGAFIIKNQSRIKILSADLKKDGLIPLTIKPEGKSEMSYSDYLLGNPDGLSLC